MVEGMKIVEEPEMVIYMVTVDNVYYTDKFKPNWEATNKGMRTDHQDILAIIGGWG